MKDGLLFLGLYFLAVILLGLRSPKKAAGLDAFFLAGRSLGAGRIAFSLCVCWIGAASLLVSTGEACRSGASAFWLIGAPAVITLAALTPLAGRIRKTAGLTLPGLIESRYGVAARTLTSFLVVWYMAVQAASQMAAIGGFLRVTTGLPYAAGIASASLIVLVYCGAGGLGSVVRTHVLQFFLLAGGMVLLLASLLSKTSFGSVAAAAAASGKSGYFDVFHGFEVNGLVALSFVLAWTISPIAWQRIQASRSAGSARMGLLSAGAGLFLFYAGVAAAGMLMLPLQPGPGPAADVFPGYLARTGGGPLGIVLFIAVAAAVLSTLDASVNAAAYSLCADMARLKPGWAEGKAARRMAFPATALVLVFAAAVAFRFPSILRTLGLASKIMAEALFIPGMAALFLTRRMPSAGLLGLVSGSVYALLGFLAEAGIGIAAVPAWPRSLLPGLAISAAGFAAGSLLDLVRQRRKAGRGPEAAGPRRGAGT